MMSEQQSSSKSSTPSPANSRTTSPNPSTSPGTASKKPKKSKDLDEVKARTEALQRMRKDIGSWTTLVDDHLDLSLAEEAELLKKYQKIVSAKK